MLAPSASRVLERAATATPAAAAALPSFLVPAFQLHTAGASRTTNTPPSSCAQQPRRLFSSTPSCQSKLGRTPIFIPPGVELTIGEPWIKRDATSYLKIPKRTCTVSGPLGSLPVDIPEYLTVALEDGGRKATLSIQDFQAKQQKEMWGTTWAYLQRHIIGVSEGHTAILRLVGVGYRASVEQRPAKAEFEGQQFVCLKLGFTHPVEEPVPRGMRASTPQPTRILIEGINREEVMSMAARVRRWRRPEPYKGKGIFVNDETIQLKQKKIK